MNAAGPDILAEVRAEQERRQAGGLGGKIKRIFRRNR